MVIWTSAMQDTTSERRLNFSFDRCSSFYVTMIRLVTNHVLYIYIYIYIYKCQNHIERICRHVFCYATSGYINYLCLMHFHPYIGSSWIFIKIWTHCCRYCLSLFKIPKDLEILFNNLCLCAFHVIYWPMVSPMKLRSYTLINVPH